LASVAVSWSRGASGSCSWARSRFCVDVGLCLARRLHNGSEVRARLEAAAEGVPTEAVYNLTPGRLWGTNITEQQTHESTGDGTVPIFSARVSGYALGGISVGPVEHGALCTTARVIAEVTRLIQDLLGAPLPTQEVELARASASTYRADIDRS
jgi:hypothetical protein